MKTRVRKALILVNTFGALGYLTMMLVWVLFACAVLFLLIQSSAVSVPTSAPVSNVSQPTESGAVGLQIIGYLITIIMAALTCAILLLLPYLIGKWGSRIMRLLMKWFRVSLTRRHLFLTKGIVIIVPLLGFIVLAALHEPLDMIIPLAHISAIFLSLMSLGCFLLQIVSAKSFGVDIKHMW